MSNKKSRLEVPTKAFFAETNAQITGTKLVKHSNPSQRQWQLPVDQTLHTLKSIDVLSLYDVELTGLSTNEANHRLQTVGSNLLVVRPRINLLRTFAANFTHLMALLLWVGGGIAWIAMMPQVAVAIWMVNVINGCFSFWQEYKAECATEALSKLIPSWVIATRDGVDEKIQSDRLVPGDIISLSAGEKVPADARLLQQASISVDESVLTGEAKDKWKSASPADGMWRESPNMLFAGTTISSGSGKAIVVATGAHTLFGQIARLAIQVPAELSPLQKEMKRVTKQIAVIAVRHGGNGDALAGHRCRANGSPECTR